MNSQTQKALSTVEPSAISFPPLIEREIQEYIRKYSVLNHAGALDSDAVLLFR
jgi:predicted house-cleaning NTP pyrophosphatase (Maf/HAM1 superfamily)